MHFLAYDYHQYNLAAYDPTIAPYCHQENHFSRTESPSQQEEAEASNFPI